MPNPVINKFGRVVRWRRQRALRGATCRRCTTSRPTPGRGPATGYMTLDDVVQRTAAMLGTILLAGAVAWVALPDRLFTPVLIVSAIGGLGLGLFMSFTRGSTPSRR